MPQEDDDEDDDENYPDAADPGRPEAIARLPPWMDVRPADAAEQNEDEDDEQDSPEHAYSPKK
jgi:hypothetical protein